MRGVARPCTIHGQELSVTASIGISLYPLDGTTPNDLLKAADTALLHAKEKERNSFCFFTAGMNNHAREWLNTAHQLRAALANDELCLHYQPQIDLACCAAWKRWCAGNIRSAAWCCQENSFLWPKRPV